MGEGFRVLGPLSVAGDEPSLRKSVFFHKQGDSDLTVSWDLHEFIGVIYYKSLKCISSDVKKKK